MKAPKIDITAPLVVRATEGPIKLKKGGTIPSKKRKGYLIGGNIKEESVIDPNYRKYGTGLSDYVKDAGLGIADSALGGIGAEDVIKSKDYKTKAGTKFNEDNSLVQSTGSAIGGAVLNYYVPGLGTAINTGKSAVGASTGGDSGISDNTKKTISNINKVGSGLGFIGTVASSNKKGMTAEQMAESKALNANVKTIEPQANTVQNVATSNAPSNLPMNTSNPGLLNSPENAPIDYQNINLQDMGLTSDQQAAYNSLKTSDEKAKWFQDNGYATGGTISPEKAKIILHEGMANGKKITDKQRRFFGYMSNRKATGGIIKGPGTGVSDSIKADLDDGGFIAIAKKKEQAEELREKYLGHKKGKIASLKKGDTPVKVSNGEVYFTEEEKKEIIKKGGSKELNSLAPEAKEKAAGGNYVVGGGITNRDLYNKDKNAIDSQTDYDNSKLAAEIDAMTPTGELTTPNPYANDLELAKYQNSVMGTQTGTVPPVTTDTATPQIRQIPKSNWFDPSSIEKAGAGLQLALGVSQLQKQGKRPVDEIPKDYLDSISKVGKNSDYGLTPQNLAQSRRDIELNRRRDVQMGNSAAGGDAISTMNYAKLAGINANDSLSNLGIENEKLKQAKQMQYSGLLGNKANYSRMLFNDKLNAFNTNQQAGANLTGAGIQNLIGGARYDKEVAAGINRELKYKKASKMDDNFSQSDIDYKFSTLPENEKSKYKSAQDWADKNGYKIAA